MKLFDMDGVELQFADESIDYIVDKAIEFKIGARGLRSIIEAIMTEAMFEGPSSIDKTMITIDKQYAIDMLATHVISKHKVA